MAGHSKWANIKHRKQRQDKARGKEFGKLIRLIEAAAREADTSDPELSPSLDMVVQKAKDADVPKDTIERACKRGAGELDEGVAYDSATYEGYAPGGVAVLVDILTDNRNRTASDVRSIFTQAGGSLAEPGAVSFLFTRRGQVVVEAEGVDEDDVMLAGLDAGLEDIEAGDDTLVAWCAPTDAQGLRKVLEEAGMAIVSSGSVMVPSSTVPLGEVSDAQRVMRLVDRLEDNDDVQEVYANYDIDDDVMAQVELD
ncbi:YebC/PmpR family DNA-binding transcriptional regulator [Salsipaludibacter albus]|uniref:YebC/PmpR family DNA-binding transcriptional regulator n=1 Tax=Salsipaludibacter albus TaxID=2849650 RepID=UPI001EE4A379|nr:YebC/PmpR family DNA-binding transcriptional regulator [Salsipaludibacter albus]